MIYIQKTGEPEEVSRWKKKFKNKHKREAGYEDIRHEKELQILKNALLAEQRHLCCYCCSYIKNTETEVQKNSFHVEHFRPQAQNQDLSLAYNNLHASCNGDNRRHCGHKKENNFDAKRMISPLEKDCESHFRYQQDGTIQPAEKTDEAAEYTITKLNLNDKRLCHARENALWTFNVFQLNGEEKQRELKKFECSEELPPYWDAIKYFLIQGD